MKDRHDPNIPRVYVEPNPGVGTGWLMFFFFGMAAPLFVFIVWVITA